MSIGALSSASSGTQAAYQASSARAYSQEDQARIDQLKASDTKVRLHEQAHLAAAGGLATSGASYTYEKGPNGVSYAVAGEVNIDTSPGRTPEESLERARTIQAAALAPADPSGQDRAVAARAQQMAQEAQQQIDEMRDAKVRNAYGVDEKQSTISVFA
ncbi:putative metalloprotease CJM1_0395 family protein [Pseudoduganella sp. UC29_106]|uniref:putative metalloprotease CJM1_0395 family protein n=1 Tax=Pseudoduganella sp. UC29_106 TaxID=3374553 RepID=UPI0037569A8E